MRRKQKRIPQTARVYLDTNESLRTCDDTVCMTAMTCLTLLDIYTNSHQFLVRQHDDFSAAEEQSQQRKKGRPNMNESRSQQKECDRPIDTETN
mmetsp:Transcript_55858/g.88875  ORF Transcript_55858/g.88875 Transcript_55858/m.88875 type:complete len:94 (-) Transcript_55858:2203-2484(-)